MKQAWDRGDTPIEPDEFYREPVPAIEPDALPEGGLPGGRETGTLLHEILENVPFDETAECGRPGRLADARPGGRASSTRP